MQVGTQDPSIVEIYNNVGHDNASMIHMTRQTRVVNKIIAVVTA